MYVLRRNVFQIDVVDLRTIVHIMLHSRFRCDEVQFQLRAGGQFLTVAGFPLEVTDPQFPEPLQALRIIKLHLFRDLKQPRAARDSDGLERWGHCQTDRLFCPAAVRHHKIGCQRIEPALAALHRGVERFKIYGRINPLPVHLTAFHCHPASGSLQISSAASSAGCRRCAPHFGVLLLFYNGKGEDLLDLLCLSLEVKIVPHRSSFIPPLGEVLPGRSAVTLLHFQKDIGHFILKAFQFRFISLCVKLRYSSHTLILQKDQTSEISNKSEAKSPPFRVRIFLLTGIPAYISVLPCMRSTHVPSESALCP